MALYLTNIETHLTGLFSTMATDTLLPFVDGTGGKQYPFKYKKDDVTKENLLLYLLYETVTYQIAMLVKYEWKTRWKILYCPKFLPLLHLVVCC
jgi:hypothetical protein